MTRQTFDHCRVAYNFSSDSFLGPTCEGISTIHAYNEIRSINHDVLHILFVN